MPPEKRSRMGCRQCRTAHHKCDETLPACHRCRAKGFQCHYSLRIRWGSIKTSGPSHEACSEPAHIPRNSRTARQPEIQGPATPTLPYLSPSQQETLEETFEALPSSNDDDDDDVAVPLPCSSNLFQKSEEMDAYAYYVDTLAGQFQAHDNLHNPYRKLSVLALSSPVLLHTILSCAVEHMHISGRLPIQQAIQQQERAIRLIRAGLSGWKPSEDSRWIPAHPAVLAFSGSNLSHAQTHVDMASFIFSKVGYLDSPDIIASSFIEKLLVQRFAIIDISLSIFDRKRPRIPAEHWLGQQRHSPVMDGSQPTLYEMTGCDHTTYTFMLQAAHLAIDRADHGPREKLYEDAIALETDIRLHLQTSRDAVSADDRPKPKSLSIKSLSRAFSGADLLLLLRRVFKESHSSPRVQNAVSIVCSAVDAISKCVDKEDDSSPHPAIDSAMALPFYLAARHAVDPDRQVWMLEKHKAWRKVYPNPARAQMMELAERIWEERSKGLDDIEARCEEVEKSYKVWIL
ncbi:fungal-specific transcription factor domain-containing protein [Stachybotrys elegans]|uniref:Fungal-specific transcription factor domain-containing protein n=1 Tax=Stachybotrys elegans TaxID=80388 RepID=A0A8K0SBW1_9HYPO|nr:fungal-specific transcription factor domain-containing protein [Stachybotrys elegans]